MTTRRSVIIWLSGASLLMLLILVSLSLPAPVHSQTRSTATLPVYATMTSIQKTLERQATQIIGGVTATAAAILTNGPATIDPAAVDLTDPTIYESPDGLFQIAMPRSWKLIQGNAISPLHAYILSYEGQSIEQEFYLIAAFGNVQDTARTLFQISEPVDSPRSILEQFFKDPNLPVHGGQIEQVTAASYSGLRVAISQSRDNLSFSGEIWILNLPDDQLMTLITLANTAVWDSSGKNLIHEMIDTIKVNPDILLTPLPTAQLPQPLVTLTKGAVKANATRTAVVATKLALTPTATKLAPRLTITAAFPLLPGQ